VKKSSDDSDDGSYIFSEKKELERDENEGQNINIIIEKSNNSESERLIIKKIEKAHAYQNMDEIEGQKK
jgi:hypothetical protein